MSHEEPAFIQRQLLQFLNLLTPLLTHNRYTPALSAALRNNFQQTYLGVRLSDEDGTKDYCQISGHLLRGEGSHK